MTAHEQAVLPRQAGKGEWLREFVPRRWLSNGHLQTLTGNFLPRTHRLPEAESRIVEVEKASPERGASHVLCHCHWQPHPEDRPAMLLVHGLEGSSRSQYMLGNAARAWAAGWNVVRMNMRNCGGTEALSPTLYHSGLSGDVAAVMRALKAEKRLRVFALVGYSMGGNLVLKLAGELGRDAPPELRAVVGVSPLMDLSVSSDALHRLENRGYEWHFLRNMRARFQRKMELFPQHFSANGIPGGLDALRTMRQFDEHITAYFSGYSGAEDYYFRAGSGRLAGAIAVPTLILHALDDPFIRMLPETREALRGNPQVTLVETRHGGHCAFLGPEADGGGYWAEKTLLGFLAEACNDKMSGSATGE